MFTAADDELSALEKRMLGLANAELDAYEESAGTDRPLPIALVTLLSKTHAAIMTRLGKRTGMDMNAMMKNPEAFLNQLDKMRSMALKVIEQRNSTRGLTLVSGGG